MKERVAALVGPVARRMWVATFHSACSRILRREAEHLGMKSAFTIYDQADAVRLTDYVRRDLNLDPKRFPPRQLHGRISALKNELVLPEAYAASATMPPEKMLAKVYTEYQRRLLDANGGRLRRPARARRAPVPRAPRRARPLAAALHPRARRRVPGHEPRAVGARPDARRRAPQPPRRRRHRPVPVPGHARHDGRRIARSRSSRSRSATRCCPTTAAATSGPLASCRTPAREPVTASTITLASGRPITSTPDHVHFAGFPG